MGNTQEVIFADLYRFFTRPCNMAVGNNPDVAALDTVLDSCTCTKGD